MVFAKKFQLFFYTFTGYLPDVQKNLIRQPLDVTENF